jgi:hypothetical protein
LLLFVGWWPKVVLLVSPRPVVVTKLNDFNEFSVLSFLFFSVKEFNSYENKILYKLLEAAEEAFVAVADDVTT